MEEEKKGKIMGENLDKSLLQTKKKEADKPRHVICKQKLLEEFPRLVKTSKIMYVF